MLKEIFEYDDYKKYLTAALDAEGERGRRSRMAEALSCQPAFVSLVLKGDGHFSQEHAVIINAFMEHREDEADYFMVLLDYQRAGSKSLRDYHRKKMEQMRAKRRVISERIGVKKGLSESDQMTYYSAWHFAAVHVLLMVPAWRTPQRLSERLKLPVTLVKDVLDFLVRVGLATTDGKEYRPGLSRIHLPADSPLVSKHHINWRLRAMQALEAGDAENLHYSGPISISKEVAEKIQALILQLLSNAEPLIREAKDEEVYCLDIDFFKI
jgi:uncharacterized protein (TIGR02147 family)